MAVPWLVVLKNIPWAEVISTAPKVADEAKKFWTTMKRTPASSNTSGESSAEKPVFDAAEAPSLASLQTQTAKLESAVDDLHEQLADSATIIKALADQNEVLVKHIEIHRSRIKLLSIVLAVFIVLGIVAILKMQAVL